MTNSLVDSLNTNFEQLWASVISFLPELIVAIIVVIVGWIIGVILMRIVARVFSVMKIDKALDAAGFDTLAERSGHKLDAGMFVGRLVKWFVILVFFVAALDILSLDQVTVFFRDIVLGYIPKVIAAVIILLGALIVANILSTSVVAAARAGGFGSANLLGKVARYAILLFAVLAALNQLEIAPELVRTFFAGIVFAASLALGLSFGLGGKEAASHYIQRIARRRE